MSTLCSLGTPPTQTAMDAQPTSMVSQAAMAGREESSRHAVANYHTIDLGRARALPVALASPAPAPDPASAPAPPDQLPRTVAACEARVQALAQELATVDTQLTDLTARRADLHEQMAVARFLERWEHLATVEEALAEVEPIWTALPTRQRDLRLALAGAHGALECAMGRQQATPGRSVLHTWLVLVSVGVSLHLLGGCMPKRVDLVKTGTVCIRTQAPEDLRLSAAAYGEDRTLVIAGNAHGDAGVPLPPPRVTLTSQ